MTTATYLFHKIPSGNFPEVSGHGITILPGFGQWVLLHPVRGESPKGAIPVSAVVDFLEKQK